METRHYRSSIDPASSQRAGRSNDLQQCDRFPTVQVQFSLWFFLCLVEESYYDPGLSCNTVMNLRDDILDVSQCLLIGFSLSLSSFHTSTPGVIHCLQGSSSCRNLNCFHPFYLSTVRCQSPAVTIPRTIHPSQGRYNVSLACQYCISF